MQINKPEDDRKSLPTRGLKGNPQLWLNQKKARDSELWGCDTSKYWIIDNKLYDLSSYLDRHPGGRNWLTMTQGQDVTDFFIIHHLNEEKARSVLQKFYVGDTPKQVRRFTFEEDGLYRTVKREMLQEMTVEEIQSETKSKMYAIFFLLMFTTFMWLTARSIDIANQSKTPYFYGFFCSFFLVAFLGIAHNFVHHKENIFKYFYVMTGFTPDQWQIMHCLSHHIYPNMELDYEAAALEPLGYFLRTQPENKVYTEALVILGYVTIQPLNFILKCIILPLTKKKMPDFKYFVPLSVFLTFYLVTGNCWFSIKLHLYIYAIYGFMANRILFCNHRLQELWSQGAERIEDFGQHTVLSTSDTDTWLSGFWAYFIAGGFNLHTTHHFFPTADQAVHHKITKIIDKVCQRKGIKRFTANRIQCFIAISKGILHRVPFVRK